MTENAQNLRSAGDPVPRRAVPLGVKGCAFLAPLSGITDIGMRRSASRFGASLVVSEMVAADAFVAADVEARMRAEGSGLVPHVVQIVGRSPVALAEAARLAEASGAHAIDINMGCPAKRVVDGFAGAALMREPDLATRLVRAVIAAVRVPVSIKMRLGWEEGACDAPDLARRFEAEGASWLTVHGRTRAQFYKGHADWDAIAAVRSATSLFLVANGDCGSAADARRMLAASGADAVMVGRAAVGRPWLVGAIAADLRGECPPPPDAPTRRIAALTHYETLLSTMGVASGVRHARKHLVAYARCAHQDGFVLPADAMMRLSTSDRPFEVARMLGRLWDEPGRRIAA